MGSRVTLVAGLLTMAAWIVFGLIVPIGAGWIHLLLALGVMLLIRAVVTAGTKPEPTK